MGFGLGMDMGMGMGMGMDMDKLMDEDPLGRHRKLMERSGRHGDGGHMMSSYSFSSYSSSGPGSKPVVIQRAVRQTGHGGTSEVHEMASDSRTGKKLMSVSRKIRDKTRTTTRTRNERGEETQTEGFHNINSEAESHAFDQRWRDEMQKFGQSRRGLPSYGQSRRPIRDSRPSHTTQDHLLLEDDRYASPRSTARSTSRTVRSADNTTQNPRTGAVSARNRHAAYSRRAQPPSTAASRYGYPRTSGDSYSHTSGRYPAY